MKNKICIVLSFLLLFIMTGCGNNEAKNGVESTLSQTEEQTEQSTDYEQVGSGTEIQKSSEAVSEPEQESDMGTKTLYGGGFGILYKWPGRSGAERSFHTSRDFWQCGEYGGI